MLYLAKGGSWLSLGQGISSLSALALAIAFANLVPKETYGVYRYVLSIAGILAAFTLTGLGTAITQSVARGFESILKDAFRVNLKWHTGLITIAIAMSVYYFVQDNIVLSISMLLIALFTPFLSGFNLFASFLNGKKKFKETTLYWGTVNILSIILMIIVLFFTQNIILIVISYFATHTFFSFIFYKLTLKKNTHNENVDKGVIAYAKHLSLINIPGFSPLKETL